MRCADAGLVQQVDGDLLQHAGANAAEHVLGGLALEDDGVDAGLVQQLAEQQAGRAGADDGDLGSHGDVSCHGRSLGAAPGRRPGSRRLPLCDDCASCAMIAQSPNP